MHASTNLAEVVPRDLGEEVVVHLVLETSAEPVHERCAGHVSGGCHLKKKIGTGWDGTAGEEQTATKKKKKKLNRWRAGVCVVWSERQLARSFSLRFFFFIFSSEGGWVGVRACVTRETWTHALKKKKKNATKPHHSPNNNNNITRTKTISETQTQPHLELPEVRSRVRVVGGHTVVSEAEHEREEQAAAALRHGEERQRLDQAKVEGQVRHPHQVSDQPRALRNKQEIDEGQRGNGGY